MYAKQLHLMSFRTGQRRKRQKKIGQRRKHLVKPKYDGNDHSSASLPRIESSSLRMYLESLNESTVACAASECCFSGEFRERLPDEYKMIEAQGMQ